MKSFSPGTVGAGADTFPATEASDGRVVTKALQDNADLLLGSELAAGNALDVTDKLLGF